MNLRRLGESGENIIEIILIERGYEIVAKNYYTKYGELDIVTLKNNTLGFWEVKTRIGDLHGHPADAVDRRKRGRIKISAEIFISRCRLEYESVEFNVAELEIGLITGCM